MVRFRNNAVGNGVFSRMAALLVLAIVRAMQPSRALPCEKKSIRFILHTISEADH